VEPYVHSHIYLHGLHRGNLAFNVPVFFRCCCDKESNRRVIVVVLVLVVIVVLLLLLVVQPNGLRKLFV